MVVNKQTNCRLCFFSCAGGRNSSDCTLILTEGDSAKTLAVSGLGVVGRDRYGVFPLRGKMLNVREASHKQVRTSRSIPTRLRKPQFVVTCRFLLLLHGLFADHG